MVIDISYNRLFYSLHGFKEWFNARRKANNLQIEYEPPAEQPHYKTVFTEFIPNKTYNSGQLVARNDEDVL